MESTFAITSSRSTTRHNRSELQSAQMLQSLNALLESLQHTSHTTRQEQAEKPSQELVSFIDALLRALIAATKLQTNIASSQNNLSVKDTTLHDSLNTLISKNITESEDNLSQYIAVERKMAVFGILKWIFMPLLALGSIALAFATMGTGAAIAALVMAAIFASPLGSQVIIPALSNAIAQDIAKNEGKNAQDKDVQGKAKIIADALMVVIATALGLGVSGFASGAQEAAIAAEDGIGESLISRATNQTVGFITKGLGKQFINLFSQSVLQSGIVTDIVQATVVSDPNMSKEKKTAISITVTILTMLAALVASGAATISLANDMAPIIKNDLSALRSLGSLINKEIPVTAAYRAAFVAELVGALGSVGTGLASGITNIHDVAPIDYKKGEIDKQGTILQTLLSVLNQRLKNNASEYNALIDSEGGTINELTALGGGNLLAVKQILVSA